MFPRSGLEAVAKLGAAALNVVDAGGEGGLGGNEEAELASLGDGALAAHGLHLVARLDGLLRVPVNE